MLGREPVPAPESHCGPYLTPSEQIEQVFSFQQKSPQNHFLIPAVRKNVSSKMSVFHIARRKGQKPSKPCRIM